ncbi:MAG: methyltransferase [Sandaracinaceae bacterium]
MHRAGLCYGVLRMPAPLRSRLEALVGLLDGLSDVLSTRVEHPEPPAWATSRGWAAPLLALSDQMLLSAERLGPSAVLPTLALPSDLVALAEQHTRLCHLPRLPQPAAAVIRAAGARKRAQVTALRAHVAAWAPSVDRVVELGAGRGHLTRALADALSLETLGIEHTAHVVERARALGEGERLRFVLRDGRDEAIPSDPRTLLVGLHACGGLGDALVDLAARTDAAVLHVACCPQKVDGQTRTASSSAGRALGFNVPRRALGLANLAGSQDEGRGEPPMSRRRRRRALYLLLREAGVELMPGDEARGVPRRQFRHPLAHVAAFAFERRGLPPPSALAIEDADRRATIESGRIRRLSLARRLLARPLELALAFDRACLLAERGRAPDVVEVWDRTVSPRNVALLREAG